MSQTIQVNQLVSCKSNQLESKVCNGIATCYLPKYFWDTYMVEILLQTLLILVAIKVQNNNKDILYSLSHDEITDDDVNHVCS